MRRAFTLQMYEQPVHTHECPICYKRQPCRSSCTIPPEHKFDPSMGLSDLGDDRECDECLFDPQLTSVLHPGDAG